MLKTQKKFPSKSKLMNTGLIDFEESIQSPNKNFKLKNMQNTKSVKKMNDIKIKRRINDYSIGIGKDLKME